MKKQLLIVMILFFTAFVAMAQIAVESFDYDLGADLFSEEGGEGWAGPWEQFWEGDPAGFTIDVAGSLPEGVDIALIGNRLRGEVLSATGFRIRRELETPITDNGSDIWISFLLESEGAIGSGWQGVSLWTPEAGSAGELCLFGKNWAPMTYGAVFRGTGVDTDVPVEDNVQVWLVAKIEFSGSEEAENVYLWVNPDPTTEPNTAEPGALVNTGVLDVEATHVACHFGNTVGLIVYFDELWIGNTFDEVIPKQVSIYKENISVKNSSCYPNPFNTSITIDFNVNSRELVYLDIYNVVGEKVKTLMDGIQNPGNYKIQWNAVDQPSGIYFYKLQVGNAIEMNKILLK
jgi:hypothetical protein